MEKTELETLKDFTADENQDIYLYDRLVAEPN